MSKQDRIAMKTILPIFLLTLFWGHLNAQNNITASVVEDWTTEKLPDSDYNLNSVYLYLLNGNSLEKAFSGESNPSV